MKQKLSILIILLSFQSFAQTDFNPFSSGDISSIYEAKQEISNVMQKFENIIYEMNIDKKIVNCEGDNQGYTADIYTIDGKVRKISKPNLDLGHSGMRDLYFRQSGEIGLVVDYVFNSVNTFRRFHLIETNKTWNFVTAEITDENNSYTDILEFIDNKDRNNDEFTPDFVQDSFIKIKQELQNRANALTVNLSDLQYFKGAINYKYAIVMQLNFNQNGTISGKYRYKRSRSDIQLKGKWYNQHFSMQEYNPEGKITGRFVGQFVNKNEVAGWWYNAKGERKFYFELQTNTSYRFKNKIDRKWLINNGKINFFKVSEAFPDKLPNGYTTKVKKQEIFDEGTRYVYYETKVYFNNKHMLTCQIEEDVIQEIYIYSPKYKTSKNMGVGNTIADFIKAYPNYNLYYSNIAGHYIIDNGLDEAQFILDENDYTGNRNFNRDMVKLDKKDFKKGTQIKKIRIYL